MNLHLLGSDSTPQHRPKLQPMLSPATNGNAGVYFMGLHGANRSKNKLKERLRDYTQDERLASVERVFKLGSSPEAKKASYRSIVAELA